MNKTYFYLFSIIPLIGIKNLIYNRHSRNKEYQLNKDDLLKIYSTNNIINGIYSIVMKNNNYLLYNNNFIFKNRKKNVWICNYRSEWIIVTNYPFKYNDIYYTKKDKNKYIIPYGLFVNNYNKRNIIILEIINEEKCYQILQKNIKFSNKNELQYNEKIYLKSTIFKKFKCKDTLNINNCKDININGMYISNYKNKYGNIYKHSINNYWIYNCIEINRNTLKINILWCLTEEAPFKFGYLNNIKYFSFDQKIFRKIYNKEDYFNVVTSIKS